MKVVYFSPTGNTKQVCEYVADHVNSKLVKTNQKRSSIESIDFTSDSTRSSATHKQRISTTFTKDDVVIMGLPVYAGRLPNILIKYLSLYEGNQASMIIVLSYGNRHYDDAAKEAYMLFTKRGFHIVSVLCAVGEHSFSNILGKNRPSAEDFTTFNIVSDLLVEKLINPSNETIGLGSNIQNQLLIHSMINLDTQTPLKPYYRPVDDEGNPFNFKDIKPATNESCTFCGICALKCPMGSISDIDYATITGPCIKCCACVKACPVGAKAFHDPNYIKHRLELEVAYTDLNRKLELFI